MIANDTNHVKETVRNFINNSINIDGLADDENLFESGIVNSLFAVQLMTFVERSFGIEIGMEDLDVENFKSVNATATFINRKTAGKAA
jgi:methoxymalonate biosynthesis acyl carrier protein